ncbi:hypothetical protein ACFVMA_14475 [Streptomyces rochei]|uniref:hypothetical protein n=1 Tax=Streptomyces rochei TaxID=1928 RepID=UPI0036851BB5
MNAFEMECVLFHTLAPEITNQVHPNRPAYQQLGCVYCQAAQRAIRDGRLAPQLSDINPVTDPSEDAQ